MPLIDAVAPDYTLGTSGDDKMTAQYLQGDKIQGLEGNDTLTGLSGDDWLFGGVGNDRLYGGAGDDLLNAGTGDDRVEGGAGNDVIVGGAGADRLSGGTGADTFRFLAQTDSSATERDVFQDFNAAEGDKFDFSFMRFQSTASQMRFLGDGDFTANGQNIPEIRVTTQNGSQFVELDRNGDGTTDLAFQVNTKIALTGEDFIA